MRLLIVLTIVQILVLLLWVVKENNLEKYEISESLTA